MASNGTSRRLQPVYFRVLIIGRANAGKTSILQRVCDTTQSPKVYRKTSGAYLNPYRNREEVQLEPTAERGQHNINDELIFPNYDHYIFHDSCGLECGKKGELTVIQDFVQEKAKENRLDDRLHAIWYCIPMDNLRPSLDLKYFHDICPDKNVPIIAVFTKYDQFKFNVKINLEDDEQQGPSLELIEEKAEKLFQAHYLGGIAGPLRHVRLERMQEPGRHCQVLIEETANALTDGRVALMLLGIQRGNLRMAISMGLRWTSERIHEEKIMGVQILELSYDFNEDQFHDDIAWLDLVDSNLKFHSMDLFSLIDKTALFVSNEPHHLMIVAIVILDLAAMIAGDISHTVKQALELAYLQGRDCGLFNMVPENFPEPFEAYTLEQYIAFAYNNRLEPVFS